MSILYVGLFLGDNKAVSQNWHYFEGGMSHSAKHMIPVDYQCCIKGLAFHMNFDLQLGQAQFVAELWMQLLRNGKLR